MNLFIVEPSFISALLETSLKGTLLILGVALIQWLGRERIPPAWRYAMWLVVVLRLVIPAGPESRFSIFNVLQAPVGKLSEIEAVSEVAPGASFQRTLRPVITQDPATPGRGWLTAGSIAIGLWGFGALLLLIRTSARTRSLATRIESEIEPMEGGSDLTAARILLDRSRRRMNIHRKVDLVETATVDAPALHGIVRPKILLPAGLLSKFEGDELEYIFLHELAHLRRHDVALNVLAVVVQAVHWFNPLVWLAFSRMREERELACDELALAVLRQDERPRYGRTILKLIESFQSTSPVPALVGITNHKEQMRRRITMIATFQKHSRKSLLFAALVILIGAVSLTEAQQTKVRMIKVDSPEASATMERLDQKISVNLAQVSVEEVFNAVSNQTGVRVSLAPELSATIGTLDRVTVKAENVPAHLALIQTASSVGLAVNFDADGAVVSKSDGEPGVMMLRRRADGGSVEHEEMVKILAPAGVSAEGEAGQKKVMKVHVMRSPSANAEGHDPVVVEEIEKILSTGEEGAKARVHLIGPGVDPATGGKRHLEIKTKDGEGVSSTGTLDIEVHSDEASL